MSVIKSVAAEATDPLATLTSDCESETAPTFTVIVGNVLVTALPPIVA